MDRMDPFTAYEVAKLRIAERHQEAARARMAAPVRSSAPDEQEKSIWRRWTLRQLIGRITLADGQA